MNSSAKKSSPFPIDSLTAEKMKDIVKSGGSVMDVVREIWQAHHPGVESALYPIKYLRTVFGLSFHDAMSIGRHVSFVCGSLTDDDLDDLLLPKMRAAIGANAAS